MLGWKKPCERRRRVITETYQIATNRKHVQELSYITVKKQVVTGISADNLYFYLKLLMADRVVCALVSNFLATRSDGCIRGVTLRWMNASHQLKNYFRTMTMKDYKIIVRVTKALFGKSCYPIGCQCRHKTRRSFDKNSRRCVHFLIDWLFARIIWAHKAPMKVLACSPLLPCDKISYLVFRKRNNQYLLNVRSSTVAAQLPPNACRGPLMVIYKKVMMCYISRSNGLQNKIS